MLGLRNFGVAALACAFLYASASIATAQANDDPGARGTPGQRLPATPAIAERMSDIMQRQAHAPPAHPHPERELEYPDRSSLPDNPGASPIARYPNDGRASSVLQPSLNIHTTSLAFNGPTLTDTAAFPPDTMGTAGPDQFVVFVNGRVRSYTKAGVADGVINADPDVFFASVMTPVTGAVLINFTSDPQIRYDRTTGRWFMSIIDVPCTNVSCTATAPNRWLLAVSDAASNGTISATTVWTFFQFTPQAPNFCDYPSLGIDVNALYVGCNMFTAAGSFSGTSGYVIQKSSVLGAGPIVVTAFQSLLVAGAGPFAPRGVDHYDTTATEGYFIGVDNATFSTLMLRRVSDPGSLAPTISANIGITLPTTTFPTTVEHAGNTGGTNGKLDALDDRLYQAMIRNGRLWTTHNICVSSAGVASSTATTCRNAARWYEVQNLTGTPSLVESGTVYDNAATRAAALQYWIPSIAATGQGHAVLGFSLAGTPSGATPAYVGRLFSDTLGTMSAPPTGSAVQFGTTTANYNPPADPGGSGGRRWGDYSFTVVDPLDDMTVWTIQEYNQALNSYSVRVSKLLAPPPATPTCSAASPIAFAKGTGNIVINAVSSGGSAFYDPGTNLPSPARPFNHLSATVTNAVVNSVTFDSLTKVTLNITANTAGLQNVTITNPDGQSVTANSCINVISTASAVSFTTQPATSANLAAGATIALVAHVVDGSNAPVSGESITLAIGNNAGSSTLAVTTNPVVTNASGDATFAGVSLNKIGSGYTLSATDTTTPAATAATSHAFNIVAGAPASLTLTTQPAASSDVIAGADIPLVAHLQDANANPIVGDDITLAISANPGSSTLGVTTNPVATDASGNATFAGVSLNKIGTAYALKATSTAAPAQTATSNAFNVVAADAATISFATGPSNAAAGAAIAPAIVVNVQDAFGNPVADATVALAIANNAGGTGILGGGGDQQTDGSGNATYDSASIDKAGAGYTLSASSGEIEATSDAFDVTPGAATQLDFIVQPDDLPAGTTTSATVAITDDFGNVETADDSTQITLSVDACGTTVLRTATVAGGIAAFEGLRFYTITEPSHLKLTATSDGELTANSHPFVVAANDDGLFWNGFESCVP
jgi:hypothetical protein